MACHTLLKAKTVDASCVSHLMHARVLGQPLSMMPWPCNMICMCVCLLSVQAIKLWRARKAYVKALFTKAVYNLYNIQVRGACMCGAVHVWRSACVAQCMCSGAVHV